MGKTGFLTRMALIVTAMVLVGCADGTRKEVGGLLGAIAGGFLGSEIGSGSGRLVATGAGAVLGGLIGADIGDGIDRAHAATRPPVSFGATPTHPTPRFGAPTSGPYAQHAPQYGFTSQSGRQVGFAGRRGGVTLRSAGYDVSGCSRLAGGFRAAFACQDTLGRWFVVQ